MRLAGSIALVLMLLFHVVSAQVIMDGAAGGGGQRGYQRPASQGVSPYARKSTSGRYGRAAARRGRGGGDDQEESELPAPVVHGR
ncbi:hypothetical protein HDU67_009705 [Dinochytrium kinnereticum]|nr:hypothetical protein HDU67_009705 [Dinochytrium kinnereticum]